MSDLKTLALAAKGWKLDTVIPATDEKLCEVGTMLYGEFYPLLTLICEDYYEDSVPLANYFVAASPDVVIKILTERDALYEALKDVLKMVTAATPNVDTMINARAALALVGGGES